MAKVTFNVRINLILQLALLVAWTVCSYHIGFSQRSEMLHQYLINNIQLS